MYAEIARSVCEIVLVFTIVLQHIFVVHYRNKLLESEENAKKLYELFCELRDKCPYSNYKCKEDAISALREKLEKDGKSSN